MSTSTRRRTLFAGIFATVAIAGVAAGIGTAVADRGAQHAEATLVDASGATIGFARFTEDGSGVVHVNVKAHGLTPGEHGIHIHAVGTCSPDFNAAGSHHNPDSAPHGSHSGDLPNMVVNTTGKGRLNATSERATLSAGPRSVFDANGSAIVIHADPDDFVTQPTGNSGARVACGVIVPG